MDNIIIQRKEVLLKLINKLLVNMNKEEIGDLTEFVNIPREDILTPQNNKTFDDMVTEIYGPFNKTKTSYYNNKKTKGRVVNIVRLMCRDAEYKFNSKRKETYVDTKFGRARITNTYYTITKIN